MSPLAGTNRHSSLSSSMEHTGSASMSSLRSASDRRKTFTSSDAPNPPFKVLNESGSSINLKLETLPEKEKSDGKSKAAVRAERRAVQEKQRAAKEAKLQSEGKAIPLKKPNLQVATSQGTGAMKKIGSVEGTTTPSRVPGTILFDDTKRRAKQEKSLPVARTLTQKQVPLFSHLPQYERENSFSLNIKNREVIHPAILRLGLLYAENEIIGSNARCIAMLNAFKQVIKDYQTPSNTALSRHLDSHLRPLINYLVQFRPLAVSMGNAIRQLKCEIAGISPDTPEQEAKEYLCDFIDTFIRHRIELSQTLIAQYACTKIVDGDVILIYARSSTVLKVLEEAKKMKKKFRVVVVDSRPFHEGKKILKELVALAIPCSYYYLNSIGFVIKEVTKVILGAHCLFSNGTVMSRVGTSVIAMMAYERNVPVIVCAESYKFSDRVQLDSFVFNEIADPDELVDTKQSENQLCDWRDIGSLKLLNIVYDVTPSKFIGVVVCEVGMIPCTSVPVVIREYRSFAS